MAKEAMPGISMEIPAIKEVGAEMPLSAEVAGAGVKVQPTTVILPKPVASLGVKAVGDVAAPQAPVVTLPLSDEQIAKGLNASLTTSVRWLAEWCVRKLKQVHMGIRSLHGKVTRVQES
jgi:hypothetical protein